MGYWVDDVESVFVVDNITDLEYLLVISNNIHIYLKRTHINNRYIWILQGKYPCYLLVLSLHKFLHGQPLQFLYIY
jgi:hypothetical protein